jgi:predicted phosphodiesterase
MEQANAVGTSMDRGRSGPFGAIAQEILDPIAELATRIAIAMFEKDAGLLLELNNRFSDHDPLWAEALLVYAEWVAGRKPIPYRSFQNPGDFVLPLPAKSPLVIAVIADWGTGTREAKQLLASMAGYQPDVLIHLGDIYYSGTPDETQENFYQPVRSQLPNIPMYTLSGNHDMYAGGTGYYPLLAQIGQPASFFCLRNDHWQFLALDTGLHDSDVATVKSNVTYLEPAEVSWHQDKLINAGGRKSILLSHHQLFSAFGGGVGTNALGQPLAVNPNLYAAFNDPTKGVTLDNVALWLWGHEHNLVVYDPYAGLNRGRCVGAGAIPISTSDNPYGANPHLVAPPGQTGLPRMNPEVQLAVSNGYYQHCYAIVTLDQATAHVDYHQVEIADGASARLYSESIV